MKEKLETYFVEVDESVFGLFVESLEEVSREEGIQLVFSDLGSYAQVASGSRFLVDELVNRKVLDPVSIPHWWLKLKKSYLRERSRTTP